MPATLRLPDPEGRLAAVRLCSDLHLSDAERSFARNDTGWRLELDLPDVARLEYELELEHTDGGREHICDPHNEHRAPGAFGEKSVLLLPGYEPPAWLDDDPVDGRGDDLVVPARRLGGDVRVRIWSPADAEASEPLPLLAAHDGPEYDALSMLTRYAAAAIATGKLPRHRVALLAPGHRDEWYSASAYYARALCNQVLPAIADRVAIGGAPVGMGASLGGLAMLHAQRGRPGSFAGLFLQSGSFFVPRFDAHESGFPRYKRIIRFVSATRRGVTHPDPVPVVLTCGTAEENVHNNRLMADALAAQGYDVTLHELPDLHNYTAWRDAFDPHLTALLARLWGP